MVFALGCRFFDVSPLLHLRIVVRAFRRVLHLLEPARLDQYLALALASDRRGGFLDDHRSWRKLDVCDHGLELLRGSRSRHRLMKRRGFRILRCDDERQLLLDGRSG